MDNEHSHVVDALPGLVWTARGDGHIDFLNQRWREYAGLGVDEAYGRGWQTAIHPEDLPELLVRWQAILASGEPREMKARLRRFNGEYRWFLFRTCPLADASGQVVKWCGMSIDIEDRRRAEEVLRAHERRFRSIVDGLPALVTLRTPAGDLEFANRRYKEYFGATLETLKGWAWGANFHPDDRADVLAAWRGAVETGIPCDIECRRRRADGVYRWFHVRGDPLRDAEGRIVLWYLLHTDIDDRKRAEALLAGEKRLLEMVASGHSMSGILEALCRLVESTASGCYCSVVLVDPSGARLELSRTGSFSWRVATDGITWEVTWSGELYRIYELDPSVHLTDELRYSRIHPEDIAFIREMGDRARGGDFVDFEYEYRLQMPDRSVKYLHMVAHGFRDQDGRLEYIGAVQDVTERRLSEEALGKVRSELARVARVTSLGALTASIAHEVNQPLSGIITNASTCLRMLAADPPNVDGARNRAAHDSRWQPCV